MINVTDDIKQSYDVSTIEINKIILEGKEHRITNVEFYDDVYDEGNIFGTAIGKCLEFEIESTIDLEGKEVEYQTGIIIDGITKWFSLGNFIIQDIDSNDTTNIAKIFATDYMIKSNIPYKSKLLYQNNNITLLRVLQEVCENSGLQLATIDFANKDFVVDSNQFSEGTLNRQVIQAIAQLSGTVAKIKNDNKLYLINPNKVTTISKMFTLNNYEEAEIKRNTHPINLVSLAMKDIEGENITLRDEESITKNGENSLVINDNPFAYTQAKREQLITALFNTVKGFEYKSYSFKCQGLPYLEALDKIQFKDKKNNTYDSYIFRFNYKSPNGLESTIEAPSITKATVNYQNIPSALDIAKRTEIIVNKQNQKITQLTQETKENEEKISKVEQDIEGISNTVSKHTESIEQVQSQTNLNTDEIAKLGSTEIVEGSELEINASNNPAKLRVWGNSVQEGEPNPSNIVPIRNVGDNVNLIYPFTLDYYTTETGNTNISERILDNSDGTYTFKGGGGSTYRIKCTQKIKANENDSFTFSFKKISGGNFRLIIRAYKSDDTIISTAVSGFTYNSVYKGYYIDNPFNKQFICPVETAYISYDLMAINETSVIVSNIKLEKGTIATPYTPYGCGSADFKVENQDKTQSKIVSFPFSKGQVLHKGDYLASDGIHQSKGTIDPTISSITWYKYTNITYNDDIAFATWNIPVKNLGDDINILCNAFPSVKSGYAVHTENISKSGTGIYIRIKKSRLETQDNTGLKKWFSDNNVLIEYELAEEIVIPYTPEQQKVLDNIKTFKGINYIYCIDEIKPEKIELEYYPNTPYNDTLVNKDTFNKVTTDMNAEFNIKANEIETSVKESTTASILTLLNNGYLTAEQVNALVNGNAEDIATVKEQLKQTVTSSQMQIEISKAIEGGVSYLKNTLFTIDENGMTIATNQDEFNALYNNKGMYLYSFDEMIAKFDVNGATIEGNLNLNGEFVTPNLRMMNVKVSGVAHTHIHWIGG